MTRPPTPNPISDILTRMEQDSSCRSGCMVPLDDDWKERMRALSQQNAGNDGKTTPAPADE